jgi:DNA-binding NtrC family response regulator
LPVQRARVLVVDDAPSVTEFLRDCLQSRYIVDISRNGSEALDAAQRDRPDVILLDMEMPGLSGIDVLERVKVMDASIPVIVVTGTPHNATVARALQLGAFAYLPKPFTIQYLHHVVAAALGLHR